MTQTLQTRLPRDPGTVTSTRSASSDSQHDKLAAVAAGSQRYLTFLLSGELYALPILDVVEIIEYRPLTTVPMMPAFIRGVLNLRGSVVPVVDLAARFGRDTTTIARRTSILIVDAGHDGGDGNAGGRRMGILVDAVNKVFYVADDDIEPPPALGADLRSEVIKGMARHDEEFIVILNLANIVSEEYLDKLASATNPHDSSPTTTITTEAAVTDGPPPEPTA